MEDNLKKSIEIKNQEAFENITNIKPTDSDIEKFEEWKRKRRKAKLKLAVFSLLIIVLVFGTLSISEPLSELNLEDRIFGIVCIFIFLWLEIYLIKDFLKSKYWTINYCNYGKVIDKYRSFQHSIDVKPKKSASGKDSIPHIIVLVENNKLNITSCSRDEYRKLNVGDDVILFKLDDNKMYIVKK